MNRLALLALLTLVVLAADDGIDAWIPVEMPIVQKQPQPRPWIQPQPRPFCPPFG